ncbi:hypothetical protein, partial [Listeria monocytogenes]|uniref:hypothetical protein n=1 Tax=Listeria monocytogenes TaxID=1639 RepID=UPI00112F1472
MKKNLEQIYAIEFTMGLRYRPMQIRHNIKLIFLLLLFVTWLQGDFMNRLPGNLDITKVDMPLVLLALLCYIILYPQKMTIRFQNLQYLLYICCFQFLVFMVIRYFYSNLIYGIQNMVSLTAQTLVASYVFLLVLWILALIFFYFHFRKKLRNGDYRKDSELQKKRSNLGLKLSKGSYILRGAFLVFILSSKFVGGIMVDIMIFYLELEGQALFYLGFTLFQSHFYSLFLNYIFDDFNS